LASGIEGTSATPEISTLSNCLNGRGAAVTVISHSSPATDGSGIVTSCDATAPPQVSQQAATNGRMAAAMNIWFLAFPMAPLIECLLDVKNTHL
jgi:hypothetical protein